MPINRSVECFCCESALGTEEFFHSDEELMDFAHGSGWKQIYIREIVPASIHDRKGFERYEFICPDCLNKLLIHQKGINR